MPPVMEKWEGQYFMNHMGCFRFLNTNRPSEEDEMIISTEVDKDMTLLSMSATALSRGNYLSLMGPFLNSIGT